MTGKRLRFARSGLVVGLVVLGAGLTGCDILDVENPQAVSPDDLDNPDAAQEVANGAAATFADAYAYTVAMSELASDAVIWVSSQTGLERLDRGIWLRANPDIDQSYNLLSVARWTSDNAVTQLHEVLADPETSSLVAESYFYSGFSLLLLGDHFRAFTIDGGEPREDTEAYSMAIERFSQAFDIAQAAGNTRLAVAALGARARAHQWVGVTTGSAEEYAAALEDAQRALSMDPGFRFTLTFEQPARPNLWWFRMQSERDLGVGRPFRHRTDPVSGQLDPRVSVSDFVGPSSNGRDSVYLQQKYPRAGSTVELVTWEEMQLIVAEVQWRNGRLGAAADAINAVRAEAGLPEFEGESSAEVRDQLIYERSAVFFLEGRRWPDARRFSDEFEDVQILPDPRWSSEVQSEPVLRKWPIPSTESESNPNA